MQTICAAVNPRLLTKANRLFTGTLPGRVIEILQNARRAGARHVHITNRGGEVVVRDDGRGVDDFARLLDLGGSGWEERLEASEDPAGVGLFCLSPRMLTIRSLGRKVTIPPEGWTGAPVPILDDEEGLASSKPDIRARVGTELTFTDEPWTRDVVSSVAVFTGLKVNVDGEPCQSQPFLTGTACEYPALGCRIQAITPGELTHWHRQAAKSGIYGNGILVNFHGQVVSFAYRPISRHDLAFLVDLTRQPTGIRLMLPARTCLVENEAYAQLKAALELEAFKYIAKLPKHTLAYKDYLRARELSIDLPEATPTYDVGILRQDIGPEPVYVEMPDNFPLANCYRLANDLPGDDSAEASAHLLAALGQFDEPFVPVDIHSDFDGYSWAKMPTIDEVEVKPGRILLESRLSGGMLTCVDKLEITATCSNGRVYRSAVGMAAAASQPVRIWLEEPRIYVTPQALEGLSASQIWFHFGGYREDSDSYETQEFEFSREIDAFCRRLLGPYEPLRAKLMECLDGIVLPAWRSLTLDRGGKLTIRRKNGRQKVILPPGAKEKGRKAGRR